MGCPHHQQTALTFLSLSYAFALIALHREEARFTLIVFIKQIRRSRRKASYLEGTYGLFCSHFHSDIITFIFFSGVSILYLSVAPVQLGLIRLLLLFWFTPRLRLCHSSTLPPRQVIGSGRLHHKLNILSFRHSSLSSLICFCHSSSPCTSPPHQVLYQLPR